MAFFISGGNVSNHCTAADRSFAKLRKGERICFKSSGARSGTDLFHSRKIVLPMPGCSPGGPVSCADVVRAVGYPPPRPMEMVAPVPLPAPAAVQVDNDLMIAKLQLGDLHLIA